MIIGVREGHQVSETVGLDEDESKKTQQKALTSQSQVKKTDESKRFMITCF